MPFGSGGFRPAPLNGLRTAGITASPDMVALLLLGRQPFQPWAPFPARPHSARPPSGMPPQLAAWQPMRTPDDGPEAAQAAAGAGSGPGRSEADPTAAPGRQQPAAATRAVVAGAVAVSDEDYRITVWTSDIRGAGTSRGPLITLQVGASHCDIAAEVVTDVYRHRHA